MFVVQSKNIIYHWEFFTHSVSLRLVTLIVCKSLRILDLVLQDNLKDPSINLR